MQADLSECKFTLNESEGLFLEMGGIKHRLINLHVHSKRMKYILEYEKFTPILNSLNQKKRTYYLGGFLASLIDR